jgi:hypothetical protein
VARLVRRIALVLTVVIAFVALQTGAACAVASACADDCSDERDCDDDEGGEHEDSCPPVCVDCHGCSGPASAWLRTPEPTPIPGDREVILHSVNLEPSSGSDGDRIERPPRG